MQVIYDLNGVALSAAAYALSGTVNGAPVNFVSYTAASAPAATSNLVTDLVGGTLGGGATAIAEIGTGTAVAVTVPDGATNLQILVGGAVQTTGGTLIPTPPATAAAAPTSSNEALMVALGAAVGYFVGKGA